MQGEHRWRHNARPRTRAEPLPCFHLAKEKAEMSILHKNGADRGACKATILTPIVGIFIPEPQLFNMQQRTEYLGIESDWNRKRRHYCYAAHDGRCRQKPERLWFGNTGATIQRNKESEQYFLLHIECFLLRNKILFSQEPLS